MRKQLKHTIILIFILSSWFTYIKWESLDLKHVNEENYLSGFIKNSIKQSDQITPIHLGIVLWLKFYSNFKITNY